MNYFVDETQEVLSSWDNSVWEKTIPNKPDWRETTQPVPCGEGFIRTGFQWNGASVGLLRFLFPKWKHPIATCRHDWRCGLAKTWVERRIADKFFKRDVGRTGNGWEVFAGYTGVTIGAIWSRYITRKLS
jgi:hypothetical protein